MDKAVVYVIIPVYKVEKYLRASIESVLTQSYPNVRIILVDDGSPDRCPEICADYAQKHSNIKVIHKENGGLSSARNAGLDSITQEPKYILFFDSDDCLENCAISGMVKMAEKTGADMVVPDRYIKVQESTGESSIALHFTKNMYTTDPKEFALKILIGETVRKLVE